MSDAPGNNEAEIKSRASGVKSFISGGFGGICCVLVGHPFDTLKVKLQTAPPGTYTGIADAVKKTLAKDGPLGFYRGMASPLVGVTPMFAVSFWGYAMGKKLVYLCTPNRTSAQLSLTEFAAAGFFSAIPTTAVAAPMERIKVILQADGQGSSTRQYKGPVDVVKKVWAEGGIRSMFRGTTATLARDCPGSAAYFVAYEATKTYLTPVGAKKEDLNFGAIVAAGGMAGIAMWTIAIPPDVIKSKIQTSPAGTYSGFLDAGRKIAAEGGVQALFRGFGPAMLRAVPANAATFVGVEVAMKVMNNVF